MGPVWEAVGYTWAWAQLVNAPVLPIFTDACDTCRNFPEFSLIIGGICFGDYFERNLLEFSNNLVTNSGIFYV